MLGLRIARLRTAPSHQGAVFFAIKGVDRVTPPPPPPPPSRLVTDLAASTHFKGFGAFLSLRLDSHRDFEPIGIVHVDFHRFLTRFVPIFTLSTGNRTKSTGNRPEIDRKSIGNQSEIDRKSTVNRSEIDKKSIGIGPEIDQTSGWPP